MQERAEQERFTIDQIEGGQELVEAGLLHPEKAVTEEELEVARQALIQQKVKVLDDEKERLTTGLQPAAEIVKGITDKQEKVPKSEVSYAHMTDEARDAAAATEAEKYEGVLKPPAGVDASPHRKMARPSMAPVDPEKIKAQAGPQGTPGPKEPVAPRPLRRSNPPPQPKVVQLDPMTIMRIELVTAKLRCADAEARLAAQALQEARQTTAQLKQEEQALMDDIGKQLGSEIKGNLRLIDRERGICTVEN